MNEEWRAVVGSGGLYEVSSEGRVRSFTRSSTPRLLTLQSNSGYPQLRITLGGKKSTVKVHRLVLAAFVGPCPPGHEVRHLDGVRTNNNLANLVYGTPSQNMRDSVVHGTHSQASKTHCLKGHPFDAANTLVHQESQGYTHRRCRACVAAWSRAFRARRKAMAA